MHPTTTPRGDGGHSFGSPSYSLRRARLSRPRDRMSSERRRAMDGPSARAVGQAGEPKEPDEVGRISGVAFLLVTFLWPRKEKLLAQARRAGETPSRPAASRPARRSRAIDYPPGRLRLTANRPYDCTAQPCLLATGTESGWTPGCHRQRGRGRPYRPKNGSQSLNTGCNPACRTAAATSPTGRSSWMANCSSSSASPSA